VDAVRIGDREALLRVLDGRIYGPSAEQPILGSESSALDAGLDWLYADLDGDGTRDAGRDAGFDDAAPSFGEPLFVVDDVIDDDRLDRHEKLVALGSSKIAAVHTAEVDYLRGESLIDVPAAGGSHGSASASVLVAGARGLGRIVGIAPDAELSIALRGDSVAELYAHTAWCISMGARVVLHEYAPWQGFFLDGSSPLEQLIDESSAAGVAHVNPAGNLSTADKLYKRAHPAASTVDIAIAVPDDAPYAIVGMSLLWRDAARPVTLTLTDPTGHSRVLPETGQLVEAWHDGLSLYAARDVSARGTVRADAYLADPERRRSLPAGSWRVEVQHGGAPGDRPLEIIAYLADDLSGWGKGIHFPDHVSEDHLIGHPGTADAGIAVAAYALHGFWGSSPGQRAFYSGRGYRIDGVEILSLAAPEDPIAAGWRDGEPATYQTFGGTSGASPHVAGAAALVLQAHPEWSGGEVRDALREGALADAAVGPAPNRDWGWGKLRIHRSLFGADPSGGPPVVAVEERRLTVGERARLRIEIADPDDPLAALEVELDRDYDGSYEERIAGGFWVSYDAPGSYAHKIRAVDPDGREGTALARVEVVAASRLEAAGGCALGGRGAQGWLWLFGGWALSRARGTRRWCAPGPRRARSGR
jgi:subtilisin family serine protease